MYEDSVNRLQVFRNVLNLMNISDNQFFKCLIIHKKKYAFIFPF